MCSSDLELAALSAPGAAAPGWLGPDESAYAHLLRLRALSASTALAKLPVRSHSAGLAEALSDAAALWDGYLYFEVHELLEPFWRDAHGDDREALQGLIQVAVGYQHLANGNLAGARALLEEGSGRLHGRKLDGIDLEPFARAVAGSGPVPSFPFDK